ncbi:CDP-diacylglycerol--glycerol-3-phosphate 3-phosphatidyltransferase [Micropruina glycogenica]|uniref:CDP-diacylglycerol--glycerol-3-phosphate 3-phosphatidyltransferase n=1 Tax=Micropruina glycogenica TaxID=75385 RepID=A0A2N9JGN3_9ACTN|nr:CDP-diacylglycerol--glycerol-3-phosphate 3-phosphatidyltransferase [Micropruina glycogenica]SPD86678.1 putative CDP-diacylglycerol--glycerol-3-phosphate 3-phosphatidyl-transferase 2 [Micropruina glycogenica]
MTDQPSRLNPANGLTLLRLVLVPVFAWILLSHPHDLWWRLGSTALFGLAIATDALDGRIARKYNLITDFGKLWDSIADKALTGMAFIGLSILGELPWWITVLVLAREWGITCMRVAMLKYGVMAANAGGKLKTVLQSIALLLFLPGLPLMPVWLQWIAWLAMAAAVLLTVVTAVPYIREAIEMRRKGVAEQEER